MFYQLEFEREIRDIEAKITEFERARERGVGLAPGAEPPTTEEIAEMKADFQGRLGELYKGLGAWDTVRVARHPSRPQTRDYAAKMCRDFCELHGDRRFGDDPAIVTGFGRLGAHKVLLVGHQKGRDTEEKLACHFGCAHPEGYRKALAKMKLAEKYGVPIVTLVDTPGAYPGLGAEERGQAEAIAVNLLEMSRIRVPIVSVVIGEGGSGGALGIAVADRVGMLQHAWYSVISPEGCAAILWKQANEQTNTQAAEALCLTAAENKRLGIVDEIIEEPPGAAHRDPDGAADRIRAWIEASLDVLVKQPVDELLEARYQRFRKLGEYTEAPPVQADTDSSSEA
ncbi:MAG: acetyl-CoA carboxylase carboxyltransferase subunit alpha [Planctomycetota bacterium]